ncbi:hypothetical protein ABFS82_08G078600 [Erythranthe guttata]|uniref:glucose-6-phosphate 1-epimerase n=2 Tax=Erythranthe guttata TaxID=4155 RepID=A0A022RJ18_ERYGU|nr:PREDICTED: putative glucose-6-phosphate 1-epimerase [Erythranthe guttata]EYU40191.1 hypothetical protein MIMGU_mgv1a010363mg [Erythranthe guttata]|eukprot:XP_012834126.1 PREDICTED: putative glucose-6-phosphate 1-epimerase [Erythranthe guttata]
MVALPATWSFSLTTSAAAAAARPRRFSRFSGVTMASAGVNVENVKVTKGLGDLPKVTLTSVHGSEAELYLYGGCVTSWKVANKDLLFVRPDAVFNGQKPISGGIPHCFPQFGPGAIQQHGFARNSDWSIVSSENVEGNPTITLELKDGPYSRSMWDYSFQALYKVTLDKNTLSTELKVTNTDEKPFSFTTALHTYFAALVPGATVRGLKGCKTLNKDPDPKNPIEGAEERDAITFPGFVDCVYLEAPAEIQLDNGLGDVITIKNTNWSDAVLWNPHLTMEACYKDFVCVENAQIGEVQIGPNESWTAVQQLSLA